MNALSNGLRGRNAVILKERGVNRRAGIGSTLTSFFRSQTPSVSLDYRPPNSALSLSEAESADAPFKNERGKFLAEWDIPVKLTSLQWILGVSFSTFLCLGIGILRRNTKSLWFRISLLPLFALSLLCFRLASIQSVYERRKKTVEELADVDSKFHTVDEVKVHYKSKFPESSSGLLTYGIHCYHGFGSHLECWNDVQQPLANRCSACVTSADLTGFGLTQRPRQTRCYTCQENAKNGREILAHAMGSNNGTENELPTALIGHSLGGLVTIVETLRQPQNVAAVVLVSPAVSPPQKKTKTGILLKLLKICVALFVDFIEVDVFRLFSRFLLWITQPFAWIALSSSLRRKSFWDSNVKLAYVQYNRLEDLVNKLRFPLLVKGSEWGLLRFTAARASESTTTRNAKDIWADKPGKNLILEFCTLVEKREIPVMIIHGEEDRLVPLKTSEQLVELLGDNVKFLQYKKCGHSAHEELPEQFVDDVSSFLNEIRRQHFQNE